MNPTKRRVAKCHSTDKRVVYAEGQLIFWVNKNEIREFYCSFVPKKYLLQKNYNRHKNRNTDKYKIVVLEVDVL